MQERLRSNRVDRRQFLFMSGAAGVLSTSAAVAMPAIARWAPLKIGLMLPATGIYSDLGNTVRRGFLLRLEQLGGKLGGRPVELIAVDDESRPELAEWQMRHLIEVDKVDLVVGSVHSGVAIAMATVARRTKTLLVVPNAGANEITGALCAPNIWRTSFSNWQTCHPMGAVVVRDGRRTAMTVSWRYAAGQQMSDAFAEGFRAAGGNVIGQLYLPFPTVEFQSLLAQIKVRKPDAVFAFFAGSGAEHFIRSYAAAGLMDTTPLYGQGGLTAGLPALREAEGIRTTWHYVAGLDLPAQREFYAAYGAQGEQALYAVHGYDTATLLDIGLSAADGNVDNREALYEAMGAARIDSARGPITFSKSNDVIQNIYLRAFRNGRNDLLSTVAPAAHTPDASCKAAGASDRRVNVQELSFAALPGVALP